MTTSPRPPPQQFCLRWNNHTANFASSVAQLLRSESFTDVTIAVDQGNTLKCHKMVLAACSTYFQELFTKNPCEHPIIILSGVRYDEIQAILDYIYRGEVSVLETQLSSLLRVATFLKVKGLALDTDSDNGDSGDGDDSTNDRAELVEPAAVHSPLVELAQASVAAAAMQAAGTAAAAQAAEAAAQAVANSALSNGYTSPVPQLSTPFSMPGFNKALWPAIAALHTIPQHPTTSHHPPVRVNPMPTPPTSFLNGSYENISEISPLGRKKISSYMANRDTPILRNVLGGQSDSMHNDRQDNFSNHSNGSMHDSDRRNSAEHAEINAEDDENKPPTTPQKHNKDAKPEWKRYKQYTRQHIMDAMAAVSKKQMSALQAASKYGIPSRTLYDKLKKAGILPTRGAGCQRAPRDTSLHAGSARFPYSSSMNGSVYGIAGTSTAAAASSTSNGVSESESETGNNGYAAPESLHASTSHYTPAVHSLNGLSRPDSADEMEVTPSHNNIGTPSSSNEDGAEDLSVGSRRSSDHSVIVPPGMLGIKEEDETSMHHEES